MEPIVLPADFMNEWAKKPVEELTPKPLQSPFSDMNAMSRVTASGFTSTDLSGAITEIEGALKKSIEYSERKDEELRRMKNPHSYGKKKREFDEIREESLKLNETIRNMAKTSIDDQRKVINDKEAVEREWEKEADEKYVTLADFTEFAKTIQKAISLHPGDSASQVPVDLEPTHNSLMNLNKPWNSSKLPGILEMESDIEGTVIGGFDMTSNEKIIEVDSYANITPVRGLPRIFMNDRLNFLSHVHSALFKLLTDDNGEYPSIHSLEILMENRKSWGGEPSAKLLEIVVDSTINLKTGTVKSNPFRIPILEPTMMLDSKIMHMALDQLHREFEIEWFNTMKTMTTPRFQSKYERNKYTSRRRRSSNNSESRSTSDSKTTSSSSGRGSRRGSGSDSKSLVSTFFK